MFFPDYFHYSAGHSHIKAGEEEEQATEEDTVEVNAIDAALAPTKPADRVARRKPLVVSDTERDRLWQLYSDTKKTLKLTRGQSNVALARLFQLVHAEFHPKEVNYYFYVLGFLGKNTNTNRIS